MESGSKSLDYKYLSNKTRKLTVVLVESASDWLDVPFDWPPKEGNLQNQYKAGRNISNSYHGKKWEKQKQHQQPRLFLQVGSTIT